MLAKPPSQNGFTLVELLVALSVTAMLMAILMSGLVQSRERGAKQADQQNALTLAISKLGERSDAGEAVQQLNGNEAGLVWRIEEQEIARGPRQSFALIQVEVMAGPLRAPQLVTLQRRYLRELI